MIRQGFAGLLGVAAACMVMADVGAQGGRQTDPPKTKPPATQTEKQPPAAQTEQKPKPTQTKRPAMPTSEGKEGHKAPKPQPTTEPAKPEGQSTGTTLGTVRIGANVRANGESLPAGTYTVRLVSEGVPGKVGQTPELSRWVEFVQGGQVKGKELTSILSSSEIPKVVKDPPPPRGGSKVERLVGGDYVRVWINRAGVHYLVYLSA